MKGVFIFNHMDDIAFMSIDDEYNNYLKKCARDQGFIKGRRGTIAYHLGLATGIQLLWQETEVDTPLDMNVILQVFSPLLASQRFTTNQLDNSYHSVKCQTGFLFCFQQFADECYIAINGDGSETEQFLHHKLRVLHSILGFLLGPVTQAIRPDKVPMRENRWHFVSTLLSTWCDLYGTEQCFLVEAVEKLQVNDELKTKCVKLLESALSSTRAAGLKYTVHALLLVNKKLLALYSSRHTAPLTSSDLLKLLLLVNTIFPHSCCHDNDLTGSSSQDAVPAESRKQYFSTSTPVDGRPATSLTSPTDSQETVTSPQPHDPHETTTTPDPHETTTTPDPHQRLFHETSPTGTPIVLMNDVVVLKVLISPCTGSFSFRGSPLATLAACGHPVVGCAEPIIHFSANDSFLHSVESASDFFRQRAPFYHRLPVFLQTDECAFSPHICHCVELMPGISLVILNEISRATHAGVICKALDVINGVLHGHPEKTNTNCSPGGSTSYKETLNTGIHSLQDVLKSFKGARQVEHVMLDICNKWKLAQEYDFETDSFSDNSMNPRLESVLGRLRDRLEELFKLLYLLPRRQTPEAQVNILQGIELVSAMLKHHLVDYTDYLMVKSFHNLTMTIYQQDFHGLVHFIYTNRLTGHMTAPSMDQSGQMAEVKDNLQLLLWQKVEWLRERLTNGYTSALVRDGRYVYSFFVWFENNLGHQMKVQQPFKGSTRGVQPGALCGDFYREMVLQCFPKVPPASIGCFELVCIHGGYMTTPQILRQDRRLVTTLRQMTRDMSVPVNVL